LPKTSIQNQLSTQNVSTITEGLDHATFVDAPEVKLQHLTNNNTSTIAPGSSHNLKGTSSTQTNGGVPHQSPPRAPSLIQIIQDNAELEQIQMEHWEDKAFEDEAAKEEELARVQQEIERLHQEQEAITRRHATA
jgi:hypothetical protein